MPRPKKKKNNMEELSQQVFEAVTDAYLNPTEDTADENGKMSLSVLANEFSIPIPVCFRFPQTRQKRIGMKIR